MKKEMDSAFDTSLYTGPKSEVVKTWMDMFTEGKLTPSYFKEWFSPKILEFYILDESERRFGIHSFGFHKFVSSGELSGLTDYLEEFIYSGEKDRVNEFLQRTGQAPSQCGKGFKPGEPSYNCKECCTDHTCVMCAECFQKSEHRHHKYRMATSTGGGYCDCGDPEAWTSSPSCETHRPGSDTDPAPPFPSDMLERSKIVFSFVLEFSHNVINKYYCADLRVDNKWPCCCEEPININEQQPSLLPNLPEVSKFPGQQIYLLLMYNDEIHTFDQVISILVQVVQCTQADGLALASRINKEGRAVIAASDCFPTLLTAKTAIERLSSTASNRFLEVHILPFQVVAHQCFALDSLLPWVQSLLKTNQAFRSALIEVLVQCIPNTIPLLDKILIQDPRLWKSAKTQWNELLCSAFLLDNGSKKILAAHYLTNYPTIMHNYLDDEEDHTFSVAGLSVQLFTVPSIAQELIERYNAMESVINLILNMSTNDQNANGKLVFKRVFSRSFERACYLLYDVRYLLSSPPTLAWPDQLREGFCRGMSSFFDFLGLIEGMDAHKRQLGTHIEFEHEWETAFNLQLKCFPVISHSLEWCASDEQALVEVFKTAVTKLKDAKSGQQDEEISVNFLGSAFKCTKFNTSENAVTMHLPLTRYWGDLYTKLISKEHLDKASITGLPIVELIDAVMRTRAMIAQHRVGMWRKNGESLSTQVFFYHDPKFRAKTLDMDIKLLQIGASLIDSGEFLTNLAYKFGLVDFVQPENETPTASELPETDHNQLWGLVDEFLHLIIVLVAERYHVGIGNVTPSDCIKHELIHLLALKPMSHSELTKAVGPRTEHELQLDAVIKDVTTFKLASETSGKGQYELKEPSYLNFNVFFYHFTRENSFNAEQIQKALHKKDRGLECCPPPDLPPFLEPFSKVINLLNCDIVLHIMKLVLDHWLKEIHHGMDGQLHKVLFLFGLALKEEEKSRRVFMFTERAKELKIVEMMVDIYCSGRLKDHKDLMKWALLKYGILDKDESVGSAMFHYDEKKRNETLQPDAKSRAEAARAKIMANMKSMQEKFSQNLNQEESIEASSSDRPLNVDGESMTCILCQGEEWTGMDNKTMVYAAFVQLSTVHMRDREGVTTEQLSELVLTTKMGPAPFISTCGHVMHAHCWEAWRMDVRATRPPRGRTFSHDPAKNEFLCPLCESISNVAMPILPTNTLEYMNPNIHPDLQTDELQEILSSLSFSEWTEIMIKVLSAPGMSKVHSTPDSSILEEFVICEETFQQDQHSSPAALQQKPSPPIRPPNEQTLPVDLSEVGYNLDFGDKWILHIKRLAGDSPDELEPDIMDITTDKLNWVHAMGAEIFKVAMNHESPHELWENPHVTWDCTMVWKTLSYTIHSLEINLRRNECITSKGLKSVGLTEREESCLEQLIKICYVLSVNKRPTSLRLGANKWALKLLKMLIMNDDYSKSMLEWDCFGVLVGLLVLMPNLVGTTSYGQLVSLERFMLQLMLISRIAQILMTLDLDKYGTGSSESRSETACLPFLVGLLRNKCIIFDSDKVWEEVKDLARPFLRCCVILVHYRQPKRQRNSEQMIPFVDDTFECYAERLGLPKSCKELLDQDLTTSLFMTWGRHPWVRQFYDQMVENLPYIKELGMNRINTLVKLPHDYSELLNKVRDFSCSNSDVDDSQNPTMCLICGKILCSLSYCCQRRVDQQKVGACTYHSRQCGGGVGIFLRIRECQLIIFAGLGRGCFKTAPYLDEHHEPDEGLRRGNKLILCEESYKQLELAWRNHSLYDMVTRSIEREGISLVRWLLF